jgi:hypothetical protein
VIQQQFEILDHAVQCVIKCIGTEEKASQFNISLNWERSDKISLCSIVSSYSVDIQEEYNILKCVSFFCDTLYSFLDEKDNLKFCFEISKARLFITDSTKNTDPIPTCHNITKTKHRKPLFVVVEMCRRNSEIHQENSSLTSYF